MKHLIPWWVYIGKERRKWKRFKQHRQHMEYLAFCYGSPMLWYKIKEENNVFGIWD